MKALLARLAAFDTTHVTGVLVVGLIAADLFSGIAARNAATGAGAVQNYVLFTTVTAGPFTVTTGTQFVSTTDQRITGQWCYMAQSSGKDALDPHVTIATASATGVVTRAPVAPEALVRFGLGPSGLDTLIADRCRFQRKA